MNAQIVCHCNRYFIDSGEVNKKGNPKLIAVDKRRMEMTGDFIWTNRFDINYIRRNGQGLFCVKHLVKPPTKKWPTAFDAPAKAKWERDGSWTKEHFTKWLAKWVGYDKAQAAIIHMLIMPPENLAA